MRVEGGRASHSPHVQAAMPLILVAKIPVPDGDVGWARHPVIEREIFTCGLQPHDYTNATRGAAGGPQWAMARRVCLHHGRRRPFVQRIPDRTEQGGDAWDGRLLEAAG
jgi:hypothetical protein